jgi:hypothetical protein
MKLWVGTGAVRNEVDVFMFKGPPWVDWMPGHGDGGEGYWGVADYGFVMERDKAVREFAVLPQHGTKELIEYEIIGNGRRVE